MSLQVEVSSDSEDDSTVQVTCRTLSGTEVAIVAVDRDASIGQLKAKLLQVLRRTDRETTVAWFDAKYFVVGDPAKVFSFADEYTKFMLTAPVQASLRTSRNCLSCVVLTRRLKKEDHSFVDIGGSTGGFVRTVLDDWEPPDLIDFEA